MEFIIFVFSLFYDIVPVRNVPPPLKPIKVCKRVCYEETKKCIKKNLDNMMNTYQKCDEWK
jgi:hypothetical protein